MTHSVSLARLVTAFALTAAQAGWLVGCADQVSCDPDQIVFEGFCVQGSGSDGGTDAGTSIDRFDCTGQPDTGAFQQTCRSEHDCSCPAPVCAKTDMAIEGFCTQLCEAGFPECPTEYTCFDPSGVVPGSPRTCVRF